MVDRRIVRLKATEADMNNYNPPPGINLIFLEWFHDKGEVIVEFVSSQLQPDPLLRKSAQDIRHELGTTWRNRLLQDNLGSHPKSPRRAMVVESILNHPFLTGKAKGMTNRNELIPSGMELTPRELKRAGETAIDVHDVEMSPEDAEQNLRLGSTGDKLDIEPDEVVQYRRLEQVRGSGHGEGKEYKEVYGPERNKYKVGVIDSG